MNIIADFHNKLNNLPKKYHQIYATKILGGLLARSSSKVIVSPDTVRITIELKRPDFFTLDHLGFFRQRSSKQAKLKRKGKPRDTYAANIKTDFETIKLHWTRAYGRDWLSVECSLPKFASGSNFNSLRSTEEILAIIENLSAFVSTKIGTRVDLLKGHFSRLDIFVNLSFSTDANVNLAITALRCLHLDRRNKMPEKWKTTLEWTSLGKKLTHELQIYNKSRQARKKDKSLPSGIIRFESKYHSTQVIKRTASDLAIPYFDEESKTFNLKTLIKKENLAAMFYAHLPE